MSIFDGENYKWGYIDKTGKEVISCEKNDYYNAESFSESLTRASVNGTEIGYIGKTGTVIISGKYYEGKDFSEGFAAVSVIVPRTGVAWGYIDKTGKEVIPLQVPQGGELLRGSRGGYGRQGVGLYRPQ